MESIRVLQRRVMQQSIRLDLVRPSIQQQLNRQAHQSSRALPTITRSQTRSIHTTPRTLFTKPRSFANPIRWRRRTFATATEASTESLSLSQRLKKLSREYGWTAVGVYFLLSALDFPFCFLAVRVLGTDRIGHWEHVAVSKIKEWVKLPFGSDTQEMIDGAVHEVETVVQKTIPVEDLKGSQDKNILEEELTYVTVDHGYKEAEAANVGSNASIWTQLALAYAIHKSFIFIRVPLTAAVLPKVVKTLRSWGYNIGKRPAKKITAGVNTKGSGVKTE